MAEGEGDGETSAAAAARDPKDPRIIARKYQLDLCKRAVEENIVVYLGTGCGKTHIAVLLMYELGHLIRKPSREQAMVIVNSTNFKVQHYYGSGKNSRDHQAWEKEMDEFEEFYNNVDKPPRVFGMTASPISGKGGSNKLNYTKCINSLEELLNAKVCSVDNVELESVVASPEIEVYLYGPVSHSNLTATYSKELDVFKLQAARTFLSPNIGSQDTKGLGLNDTRASFVQHYLNKAISLLGYNILDGLKNMSRNRMNSIIEKFSSGKVNLLVATSVGEEGLDIQTCCLVVRGNQCQEKLLNDYVAGESFMNKEINLRTSDDLFDCLEENIYRVKDTGASVSTACSVSLLHRYCDNLPRDMFFIPSPAFFYVDDVEGVVCRLILPPNAPFRQVNGQPCPSKDEAKRDACLKACIKLHELGALTDFLLPGPGSRKIKVPWTTDISESNKTDDEGLREELHEMLIPAVLRPSRCKLDCSLNLHFYYIEFIPIPADRRYQMFGLFVIDPLPKEAEKLDVELHLARARIMMLAHNFQEMFLKVLLDRSEFTSSFVLLKSDAALQISSTFYLLLPIKKKFNGDKFMIDWSTVKRCLASPVFQHSMGLSPHDTYLPNESLKLLDGTYHKADVTGSLVFTPHNDLFFFVDVIMDEINAKSEFNGATYEEHFKERFDIELLHPEQPLLKAKQLFNLRNLLHNRQEITETEGRELMEHFVELPPELCCLKITGFSKDMGSSLSLLPSLMCRLENLLVAIELKDVLFSSFPEASQISALVILEALTTERCLERMSLERFEVLGDAFLKYVVGRHNFISYEGLDEVHYEVLTMKFCSKHQTIADVVESLLGAFIVECGFKAAFAFLHWMGIKIDFKVTSLYRVLDASSSNLSLLNYIKVAELEELIGYKFKHKGLLIQAFVHPSFNKHSGGCYQRMEFLGDAVLEYLMTSYLYSTYPDLKPGQITDLKSLAVNNNSFAYVAVKKSIHKFLGDIVESCVGAVLLDSGFNLNHNYGYRHRSKSLEQILRVARKKESILIGYDEEPIKVEDDISVEMNKLQLTEEMDGNIFSRHREVSFTGSSQTSIQSTGGCNKVDKNDADNGGKSQLKVIWYAKQQGHSFMNYVLQTIGNHLNSSYAKKDQVTFDSKFIFYYIISLDNVFNTVCDTF
ncbi:hypothetical protein PR202_gb15060 [Eleusine coracana subsp. coracana]|uniref:Uncharacterized protein n=1 Tax=Eleusine coracana subsp. coracana TaxID=191504 RepID=A0AAV5EUK0_ELECO|nr:hypothetical protein PR202_gb15060 [Eleusine coracana subsp. coracana]